MSSTSELHRRIRKLNLIGLATVAILVFGVGGWAAVAQLSGAVIASGFVVVESNVKKVQHPNGGIVGQIFVKEGSEVEEGQVVVRLDDTVPRANLGVIRSQLDELTARQARLTAERDNAEAISFPEELTARGGETQVATAIIGEQKLFESRRQGAARSARAAAGAHRADQRRSARAVVAAQGEGKRNRPDRRGAQGRQRALREEPGQHHALHGAAARPRPSSKASTASSAPRSRGRAAASARSSCRSSSSKRTSAPRC